MASLNTVHSYIIYRGLTRTLEFTNVPFLLEFLVIGVNGYSSGWFHVKLCEMHGAHLLYMLSSATGEHTNSSVVG
jgi:hypothetical protein